MREKRREKYLKIKKWQSITWEMNEITSRRIKFQKIMQSAIRSISSFFSLVRLYIPLCRSVRASVRPSHFTFFCGLWPHCSCPNDQVTSNMSPAHPHATGVAVYPALFQSLTVSGSIDSPCFICHLLLMKDRLF